MTAPAFLMTKRSEHAASFAVVLIRAAMFTKNMMSMMSMMSMISDMSEMSKSEEVR